MAVDLLNNPAVMSGGVTPSGVTSDGLRVQSPASQQPHWSDVYVELLREALPLDLPENRPVYLITAAEAGGSFRSPDGAAFAGEYLDIDLRQQFEDEGRWIGPGYAIVIKSRVCIEHPIFDFVMGILGHEISHSIDIEGKSVVRAIAQIDFGAAEKYSGPMEGQRNYTAAVRPLIASCIVPPWWHHDKRWIRTALHVGHRLSSRYRRSPRVMGVAGDGHYVRSSADEYRTCLRDELHEMEQVPVLDILKTPAPAAFEDLWRRDTQSLITTQ